MYINDEIREDIRTVYGLEKELGSDKDYMDLRDDIKEQTGGKNLDINTLKRMMIINGKF